MTRGTVQFLGFALSLVPASALGGGGDIVLTSAWRPPSHARIDCRGGTIRPAVPAGVANHQATPAVPDTLLFLDHVVDVRIENCVLADADQGILIVGGGDHQIRASSITARRSAIRMFSSSGNEVSGNRVFYGEAGVLVRLDSDHVRVFGNRLEKTVEADVVYDLKGAVGAWSEPIEGVVDLVVDGALLQLPNGVHMLEDLQIHDNVIDARGGPGPDDDGFVGIGCMTRTEDCHVWDNVVRGGSASVASFGFPLFIPVVLPGHCSLDPSRLCTPNGWWTDSCFIPGIDASSKGDCVGGSEVFTEGRVIRSRFERNVISDGFICLSAYYAPSTVMEGNLISHCGEGIEIGDYMLESGTVVGNVVRENGVGLYLSNTDGAYAGATVSYNDFVDNDTDLAATQWVCDATSCTPGFPYTFDTVLPHNFWGGTCEPGGDFPPIVTAPGSYGAPVARRYEAGVPPSRLGPVCN